MNTILWGDCRTSLATFKAFGVKAQTCITSPPYFNLRTYLPEGHPDKALELGAEQTPEEYIAGMVDVFRGVRDVLADDGTLWLNVSDSYANDTKWGGSSGGKHAKELHGATGIGRNKVSTGLPAKNLVGIPWRLAFALQADGWILRQDLVWAKAESGEAREGRCMPESVRDRFTKSHEYVFMLAKAPTYYFDADAAKEPGQDWGKPRDRTNMRGGTTDPKLKHGGLSQAHYPMANRRSVWRVSPAGFKGAHFAVFPWKLIEPCVLAGSRPGDIVLDPFMGSGTTAGVALRHGRQYIGCELNREYEALQAERIAQILSAVA